MPIIDNLEEKLNGEIPINLNELFILVNSWGRSDWFYTRDKDEKKIKINNSEKNKCYDLSKLDTSEITNMDNLFRYSLFNGDISKWNVSSVTSMNSMFRKCVYFNSDISDWNVFNVTEMEHMFAFTYHFNKNIGNWDVSNVDNMESMFYDAKEFTKKYNNGKSIAYKTNDIKDWFNNNNRERMNMISIKEQYGEEIDNFFSDFSNNHLLTECNKSSNRMQQAINCL